MTLKVGRILYPTAIDRRASHAGKPALCFFHLRIFRISEFPEQNSCIVFLVIKQIAGYTDAPA